MTTRRDFMATAGFGVGALGLAASLFGARRQAVAGPTEKFPLTLTDAEWHQRLTPTQFSILREEGTERAFTSPLNNEHRKGIFACAGCGQKLYRSETKFDSGTGWPSFYRAMDGGIGERNDRTLGMLRTEVHCANCGGHLGHVFDDGPQPTGLRYCMNGVAMKFEAA